MKIYALFAHPDQKSFNGMLFYNTVNSLVGQGHEVDVLDLYQRMEDIPFYTTTKPDCQPTLHTDKFFHENRERLMVADGLFIVYPIFWYSVPGVLKCWIDLITNFAWQYEGGKKARPLHKVKKSLIVNTSMESWWHRRFLTTNPSRRQIALTFDFIGLPHYDFYEIGSVHKLTESQKEKHYQALVQRSKSCFPL